MQYYDNCIAEIHYCDTIVACDYCEQEFYLQCSWSEYKSYIFQNVNYSFMYYLIKDCSLVWSGAHRHLYSILHCTELFILSFGFIIDRDGIIVIIDSVQKSLLLITNYFCDHESVACSQYLQALSNKV